MTSAVHFRCDLRGPGCRRWQRTIPEREFVVVDSGQRDGGTPPPGPSTQDPFEGKVVQSLDHGGVVMPLQRTELGQCEEVGFGEPLDLPPTHRPRERLDQHGSAQPA